MVVHVADTYAYACLHLCLLPQGYPDEPEISGRTGLLSPSARRRNGPFTSPGTSTGVMRTARLGSMMCIRAADCLSLGYCPALRGQRLCFVAVSKQRWDSELTP